MSVVDFAIHQLKVQHVIVCGHYGCAGVHAAMGDSTVGAVDHWLSGIRELWDEHKSELQELPATAAESRLCELNVQQQVRSLCRTTVMKDAWSRGQDIQVHGRIYGIQDGLLRNLGDPITAKSEI
jgi:carbonic anhydrase